jgi:hypothetical protein
MLTFDCILHNSGALRIDRIKDFGVLFDSKPP